ncbi:hypothetical protein KUCAC02_025866, partial [Chaenocephalus aceratus]
RKSQSGFEPTADGHPIIHSRFFSSETGVGIGKPCVEVWVVMQITNCTGHRGKKRTEWQPLCKTCRGRGGTDWLVQASMKVAHPGRDKPPP